jgi:curved DNA-binding protein CbpA
MNPFEVLEISADASSEDIKAAYHRLAKRWHPDRFTGDEKAEAEGKFRELAEAFSILKDPVKRMTLQQQLPKVQPGVQSRPADAPPERTADDWADLARQAFEDGRHDQARALIHYAIRMNEEKAAYHSLLANILEQGGDDPRAVVRALETAVRLEPRNVDCHIRLASHFQALGMSARAQRHLQTAREISPNHPKLRQVAAGAAKAKSSSEHGAKAGAGAVVKGKTGVQNNSGSLLDQLKGLWGRLTGKG